MVFWGWSGLSHDAALCVYIDNELKFASQAERYSRVKNDRYLNQEIVNEALQYGYPDEIFFYEKPLLKKTRQLYAGQWRLLNSESPKVHLKKFGIETFNSCISHHESHAAAGFFTSPFDEAVIICLDSIGEWECMTIWAGEKGVLTKKYSQNYPHSVGLWYSAMTQRIGLKPQEHEYILMGLSALGCPDRFYKKMCNDFISHFPNNESPYVKFKENFHKGCLWWMSEHDSWQDRADIAAATQRIYEEILEGLLAFLSSNFQQKNLVFMGGCALNSLANRHLHRYFSNIWILPSPGDSGSCIGAVLANKKTHHSFNNPFLGHNISGSYPTESLLTELNKTGIVGVANGRAEFGPRALGHRSLLADPRSPSMKNRLNKIKKRESFRPFALAILEEKVDEYFDTTDTSRSPYMQFVMNCIEKETLTAGLHADGTSRIQTVSQHQYPDFHSLLSLWYKDTGVPALINTSLNIKGEPLINSLEDCERWKKNNQIKIFS